VMLILVFVLSSFLDNIQRMIAARWRRCCSRATARRVSRRIVALRMRAGRQRRRRQHDDDDVIAGVPPLQVVDAYVAAVPRLIFFSIVAARQQHATSIVKDAPAHHVDAWRFVIVGTILLSASAPTSTSTCATPTC